MTEMRKKMNAAKKGGKRFRFPYFYAVLLIIVLTALTVLFMALNLLRDWLADYESAQSKYIAQEVFEEYYSPLDLPKLLERTEYTLSPAEDADDLAAYLSALIGNSEITYRKVSTGLDENTEKYVVEADGKKFSEFYLTVSEDKSKYGTPLYALSETKIFFNAHNSVTVTAPADSAVYINGYKLPGTLITGAPELTDSCAHMPEGVRGLMYVTYTLDGLLNEPEIRVVSREGESLTPQKDGTTGAYRAEAVYSDTLKAEYSDFIMDFAKTYSVYMQGKGSFKAVSAYLEANTELYEQTRTAEVYFVMPYTSYSFEDMTVGEFYAYDENTFSCRISYVHLLHKEGSKDFRDYIDMTLYLRRTDGGKYLIYDRENN